MLAELHTNQRDHRCQTQCVINRELAVHEASFPRAALANTAHTIGAPPKPHTRSHRNNMPHNRPTTHCLSLLTARAETEVNGELEGRGTS